MTEVYALRSELRHHGILGQKWGVQNGPPYPLGASDHSVREKKAGWRKSLDSKTGKTYNVSKKNETEKESFRLTDKQKKAVKIGAAAAGVALVAVGGVYLAKSGRLNELAALGKSSVVHVVGNRMAGNADDVVRLDYGFKKLPSNEKLADTLKNTNPLRGTKEGHNNCAPCGIVAFLRMHGFDVVAKGTTGQKQNMAGLVEECFKNAKVFDGSAVKFGRSSDDASEMLIKRFGQDAEGICNIQWRGKPDGHVFNWLIKSGEVTFFDAQNGLDDAAVRRSFWRLIDPQGFLQIARLDNAEINFDAVRKIAE